MRFDIGIRHSGATNTFGANEELRTANSDVTCATVEHRLTINLYNPNVQSLWTRFKKNGIFWGNYS